MEPFWSEYRITTYFQSLQEQYGDRFYAIGLFVDSELQGFVSGFPTDEEPDAFYLDFITVSPELRRMRGVRAAVAAGLLWFRYTLCRRVPWFGGVAAKLLTWMEVPTMELMREFFRELVRMEYNVVYARIITSRKGLRRNMYIIGFDEHAPCSTDPNRALYRRPLVDIRST